MSYRVEISKAAAKDLRKLPRDVQEFLAPALNGLAENPRPHGSKKLAGSDSAYRIRVGDYRIVYTIRDDILFVQVVRLGQRGNVYENL